MGRTLSLLASFALAACSATPPAPPSRDLGRTDLAITADGAFVCTPGRDAVECAFDYETCGWVVTGRSEYRGHTLCSHHLGTTAGETRGKHVAAALLAHGRDVLCAAEDDHVACWRARAGTTTDGEPLPRDEPRPGQRVDPPPRRVLDACVGAPITALAGTFTAAHAIAGGAHHVLRVADGGLDRSEHPLPFVEIEELRGGAHQVCARAADGRVACSDDEHGPMRVVPDAVDAEAIAVGDGFACTLSSKTVRCWGDVTHLGRTCDVADASTSSRSVRWPGRYRAIAAAGDNLCALAEDGHLRCGGRCVPPRSLDIFPPSAPGEDLPLSIAGSPPARICVGGGSTFECTSGTGDDGPLPGQPRQIVDVYPPPATRPSRATLSAAFEAVRSSVEACAGAWEGTVMAYTVIAGSTGRVMHVQAAGADVPPEVASCVERETGNLRVSPFDAERTVVNFPWVLHARSDDG